MSSGTDIDALTQEVVASFEGAPDERTRELLQALTRHLHAFAIEVGLREDELVTAIDFLTRTGQKCTSTRQEVVLLSDVVGLSMRAVANSHPANGPATESTVLGPFFVEDSPPFQSGDDLSGGAPGEPCLMRGTVRGDDGRAVPGARMDVWQADAEGLYDVQIEALDQPRNRGHLHTDAEGRYAFWASRPVAYPIPVDGPVGELLRAGGRGPWRPAHVHVRLTAPGYAPLTTHIFDAADEHLSTGDAVFGVRAALIAPFRVHEAGTAPDGREMDEPWSSVDFDFVMGTR